MMTNDEIFAKAINEHPMNAGILREALKHYMDLINDSEPWGKEVGIDFNSWKTWTNDLKDRIDELYSNNSKTAGVAPVLTDTMQTLLLRALKTLGTYDPDEVLPYIEEDLTRFEIGEINDFLDWVTENKRTFGHGNIQQVWNECFFK